MLMHAGLLVCFFASFFPSKTTGCCFCVFSFQDVCSSLGRYLSWNPWPFFFSSCSSFVLLPACLVWSFSVNVFNLVLCFWMLSVCLFLHFVFVSPETSAGCFCVQGYFCFFWLSSFLKPMVLLFSWFVLVHFYFLHGIQPSSVLLIVLLDACHIFVLVCCFTLF